MLFTKTTLHQHWSHTKSALLFACVRPLIFFCLVVVVVNGSGHYSLALLILVTAAVKSHFTDLHLLSVYQIIFSFFLACTLWGQAERTVTFFFVSRQKCWYFFVCTHTPYRLDSRRSQAKFGVHKLFTKMFTHTQHSKSVSCVCVCVPVKLYNRKLVFSVNVGVN